MTQPAAHWLARLATDGYCLIPDALPPATIARLDADLDSTFAATPFSQGGFYGARTKRFGGLLKRSREAEALVRHRLVLQIVDAVLARTATGSTSTSRRPRKSIRGRCRRSRIAMRICGPGRRGSSRT